MDSSGIYFIAAGNSSENRTKTLERAWSITKLGNYIPRNILEKLNVHFPTGQGIYAWGANENSFKQLNQVKPNEFVVDVRNREVVQVFNFCFWYKTSDSKLQNLFGWDSEKSLAQRRPYRYVYFLSTPTKTVIRHKSYFGSAFGLNHNQNWLVGQKYMDSSEVHTAMKQSNRSDIYQFLGIKKRESTTQNTTFSNPEEIENKDGLYEGSVTTKLVNTYERNPRARKECIEHYGYKCQGCDLMMESMYGKAGKDFIHVHHLVPISQISSKYVIDPIHDLIPLCPNCHSMVHRKNPPLTVKELREIIIYKES